MTDSKENNLTSNYDDRKLSYYYGGVFHNLEPMRQKNFKAVFKMLREKKIAWPSYIEQKTTHLPCPQVMGDMVSFRLVGHSTVLIQLPSFNLLTDSIWAKRASCSGLMNLYTKMG